MLKALIETKKVKYGELDEEVSATIHLIPEPPPPSFPLAACHVFSC